METSRAAAAGATWIPQERAAEAALRRISKGGGDSVDRTEFLELWLLGAGLMSEATLAHVKDGVVTKFMVFKMLFL